MTNKQWFEAFDTHLMNDEHPDVYFDTLADEGDFPCKHPFEWLYALRDVKQSPKHHPEGDVWRHTMLVVGGVALRREKSKDARALMWAALLHDLGKLKTTRVRHGRITAYDHDKAGAHMVVEFLLECGCSQAFIDRVVPLVRWHMQPLFVVRGLPFADLEGMMSEVDLDELVLLALADRLGRGQTVREDIAREEESIRIFIQKSRAYADKYYKPSH